MIDWAIEAWNDYGEDLKEYLQNEEVIKSIEHGFVYATNNSLFNGHKLSEDGIKQFAREFIRNLRFV